MNSIHLSEVDTMITHLLKRFLFVGVVEHQDQVTALNVDSHKSFVGPGARAIPDVHLYGFARSRCQFVLEQLGADRLIPLALFALQGSHRVGFA
jgi:hypothetical protein